MSPAKRRTAKPAKRAAKRSAKKTAPKRATRKAAPKRAAKRSAKKTAPKRATRKAAPKRAAKRAVKKAAPKRATRKATPKRPALRVVRRPAPRPAPPPAFPQAQDGSAKQKVLFELVRARTTFMAAIHGLPAGAAERPLAPGKWTLREVALHLVARDRARLLEMEGALLGRRASWIGLDEAASARMNEDDLAPLRHHSWDEALRLLQTTRQHLMEAIEAVPAEPAEVWAAAHPFGEMMLLLPAHDRQHAGLVKAARTAPR